MVRNKVAKDVIDPDVLAIASETELGRIKVGENLTIEPDGTLNAEAGASVAKVDGLNREVAYLKLRQDAVDRIDGGVTFADDMGLTRFGMTLDEVNSHDIKIRDGKMVLLGKDTLNPNVTDATVISEAHDTSGNGGRKLVSNSTDIFAVTKTSSRFYVHKRNKETGVFTVLQSWSSTNIVDASLVATGTRVYVTVTANTGYTSSYTFDANTGASVKISDVDAGQSAIGNVSLAINEAKTELHCAWTSKNSALPNSWNIRYAKGVIQPDGSVVWSAVEQLTTTNVSGNDWKNPTLIVVNNSPVILFEYDTSGTSNGIYARVREGASWSANKLVYNGETYKQSSPSAIFVPKSINGLANGRIWVAWHGKEAVYSSVDNVRVSYSDDGGVTWSAMYRITSGNTKPQQNPSITANKNGNVYIVWNGYSNGSFLELRQISNTNNVWGDIKEITTNTSSGTINPSTLFDLSLNFTEPLFIYKGASKVGFYGTWSEQVDAPRLTATAVYDIPSTDYVGAFVRKSGSVDVQAYLNDELMESELEDKEYLFTKSLKAKAPTKLRLELSRQSIGGGEDDAITRILGGRS